MIACIDGGLLCIPLAILLFLFPPSFWFVKWITRKTKRCKDDSCKCDCHNKTPELSDYPDTESWSKDFDYSCKNKHRRSSRIWDDL
jgi:hypothetical protein